MSSEKRESSRHDDPAIGFGAGRPRDRMRRRGFLTLAAGAALACQRVGWARQKTMPVIGYLGIGSSGPFAPLLAAFRQGLAETGYVEGKNVAIEYRWAEGHEDRLAALVADLVDLKVDVIATSGGVLAARAAKSATTAIPIVFETGFDPVAFGLVASLAQPGGNLTGVSILTAELNPKRLQLLSELVPQATAVAVLVNPNNASADRVIRDLEKPSARKAQLHILTARGEYEFETAFASLAEMQAGALLVANDPVFFSRRDELVRLAARYAIPAMYEWREFVAAGGLISYGPSLTGMFRRKGVYVGRILAGANPANLPVDRPTKFELAINLKTARTLRLTVPMSLLAVADDVIE
jgi:putative tryptophan/tyrosine transport system substrate-binding protein